MARALQVVRSIPHAACERIVPSMGEYAHIPRGRGGTVLNRRLREYFVRHQWTSGEDPSQMGLGLEAGLSYVL